MTLICGPAALAGTVNGDFDTPPAGGGAGDPWQILVGGGGPNAPIITKPSPAGLGLNNFLLMGDRANLLGGANPSITFQDFNPGNSPTSWHVVTFSAEFNPGGAGEVAYVELIGGNGAIGVWSIPAGGPNVCTVAIQDCTPVSTVAFAILNSTRPGGLVPPLTGDLSIDDVADDCQDTQPVINLAGASPGQFPTINRGSAVPLPSSATAPTDLNITYSQGQISITWTDSVPDLESAYEVNGPWFPVPGATSPYSFTPTSKLQFFRLNYSLVNTHLLPTAVNQAYSVLHDRTSTIPAPGVLLNTSDPLGQALTAEQASAAWLGNATLMANGSFAYTPPPLFAGLDFFNYVVNDGTYSSTPATVTILVSNNPPVAVADSFAVHAGVLFSIAGPGILANDYDPDGDIISVITPQSSGPSHGSLELDPDGSFTYLPYNGFSGTDSFTYAVTDRITNSASATVTLNVHSNNTAPLGSNSVFSIAHDLNLHVSAPGLLLYASDADGDQLTSALVSGATHGTATVFMDGSFTYIPNPGFIGSDGFVYEVNDGIANSTPVSVLLKVTNTAPVAVNYAFATHPGQPLNVTEPGVLLNDTDAEDDPLTAQLQTSASNGTLTLNADGSFTYTPTAGFVGVDSFTYSAFDGFTSSVPALVSITVSNQPPIAVNDAYAVPENATLTVTAPGVLLNDYDPDGDHLTAALVTGPANGTVTLNTNGSFTYQPLTNFSGTDSFTYEASNGFTNSAPATVSLTVHASNSPPTADGLTYQAEPNNAMLPESPLTTDIYDGVLTAASDPDNDALTAVLVTGPTNAASFNLNADGTFSYLPQIGFTGVDAFTYQAFDGLASSSPAAIRIEVGYHQEIVPDTSYSIHMNTLLAEDAPGILSDVEPFDSSPVTVSVALLQPPVHGVLTLQTNGAFTYLPATNFVGTDEFVYRVYDGVSNSPPATARILVTDAAPVAGPETYFVAAGGSLSVAASGVLTNAYDDDNDPLTAASLTSPSHSTTFTLHTDGSFLYVPQHGFTGTDYFSYQASDGAESSGAALVTIVVTGAPLAMDDVYEYTPGVPLIIGATNGVLQNDFDPTGAGLAAEFYGGSGLVSLQPDGSFTFQSPSVPPGGAPITFQYEALVGGVYSLPATVTLLAAVPAAVPPMVLQEVTFSGGTDVLPDNAGAFDKPFKAPQWSDADGSGVIDPAKGEHAYPYSYVQGGTATIAAKFLANDASLKKLKNAKLLGVLFDKDKADPLLMSVQADAENDGAGHFIVKPTVTTGAKFETMVGKLAPLLIVWEYSTDKGAHYYPCGASTNVVYLTLAAPKNPGQSMFQTPLEIGCTQGAGATNNAAFLAQNGAVWKYFETRKVKRATDGAGLTYYNDWGTVHCNLFQLLADPKGDGQCNTFAELLRAIFRAQGMDNTVVTLTGLENKFVGKSFFVNKWNVVGGVKPRYINVIQSADPLRQTGAGLGAYLWENPPAPQFTYAGGASQNNANPAANFDCHYIVKVVNGASTYYYDPSYGSVYNNETDTEKKAVAAYVSIVTKTIPAPPAAGGVNYDFYVITPVDPTAPPNQLRFYFPAW